MVGEIRPEGASIKGTISSNGRHVADIEMMFAHLDQSRAPVETGEENFVFTEDFIRMLRLRNLRNLAPTDEPNAGGG